MTSVWSFPTRVVFGAGSVAHLGREVAALELERVLVVTDEGVVGAGLMELVAAALSAAGILAGRFTGVQSNPTEANIEAGAAAYGNMKAQGVVAVGGGSPIDAGKLIALRSVTERSFDELDEAAGGERWVPASVPPVLALPTTAGTGSEVGRSAVVAVGRDNTKKVVFSPRLLPRVALLDPELTRPMPPGVTAATGFDALTHCIEAYLALGDHPMADAIALGGLELIAGALERACRYGGDLKARGDMQKAAMMGGLAFQKGLGACHCLAHPLSSKYDLHHGLANALCLPTVVEFNRATVPERVDEVFRRLRMDPDRGVEELRALRARLGLPGSFAEAGVSAPDLEALAAMAFADGCHRQNPRPCTEPYLRALYESLL